jgi:hypothetical protein
MSADFKRMHRQVQLHINEVATATNCAQTMIKKTAPAAPTDMRILVVAAIREKIRAGFKETGSATMYDTPPSFNRFGGGAEQMGHVTQCSWMTYPLKLRSLLLFFICAGGVRNEVKPLTLNPKPSGGAPDGARGPKRCVSKQQTGTKA